MTKTEAAAFLSAQEAVCILTHRNPDGDTIGCAAALCRGLRALGKDAWVLENPQFTPRYDPWLDGLLSAGAQGTVVSVDIASASLLPDNARPLAERIALAVDHHASHTGFAARSWVVPEAAACGELVHALLLELGAPITSETASAIYLAVSTDTGCFQYSNTTSNTLRVAAAMRDAGCDAFPINRLFFGVRSRGRLRLESRLTEAMTFFAGGAGALCVLPRAWMDELGLTEDDLESISGFPRSVEGVEIGVMLRETAPGRVKLSLRTGPGYDAAAICAHLGGGGHRAAAGAALDTDLDGARAAVRAALQAAGVEG